MQGMRGGRVVGTRTRIPLVHERLSKPRPRKAVQRLRERDPALWLGAVFKPQTANALRIRRCRARKRNGDRLVELVLSADLLARMAAVGFDPGDTEETLAAAVEKACEAACWGLNDFHIAPPPPSPTPRNASHRLRTANVFVLLEQCLGGLPDLINAERAWLRQHPDAVLDEMQAERLNAAYYEAAAEGLERGSVEYFEFLDRSLEYG